MDHFIAIKGKRIPVCVRTNERARRLIVRVEPTDGRVVVIAPDRRSVKAALNFAEAQKDWIAERLRELPQAIPFVADGYFPLRGETCLIDHHPRARAGAWLEADLGGLRLCVSGETAHLSRRVTDYLRRAARADLSARVDAHCATLKLRLPRITIRDTATRWGSCSARTGLSFSWRLIFAPPFVLDYVAAHEVSHLKHMNHSKAFWRVVENLIGDPAPAHHWLSQEGPKLHRYGRSALLGARTQAERMGDPLK